MCERPSPEVPLSSSHNGCVLASLLSKAINQTARFWFCSVFTLNRPSVWFIKWLRRQGFVFTLSASMSDLWAAGSWLCTVMRALPSVCTCYAYRRALSVFLAGCLSREAPCCDRSGGGGRRLKSHWRALILLIRSERDVAFPHSYLHTVNLSLGGPSKLNPRRHAAISGMRREGRRLRCWLTLLSALWGR